MLLVCSLTMLGTNLPNKLTAVCLAAFLAACQEPTTTTNELGLQLTTLEEGRVAGRMTTLVGAVDFVVEEAQPGQLEVRFDRGQGQFGSSVDWNAMTADFAWPDGMKLTDDDRFILNALALAVENEIGKDLAVTDNLFRSAALWGAHPVGDIILKPIVADADRGWTKLCSAGACNSSAASYTFTHSGGNTERSAPCGKHASSNKSHSRKFGKKDTINPCLSRCGPGCSGVGTSAWTKDCGNHDICEYWHTSDCGSELSSASDDYVLSANCSC